MTKRIQSKFAQGKVVSKDPADDAWRAYNAICLCEKSDPGLALNPYWIALRDSAYARFQGTMEAGE